MVRGDGVLVTTKEGAQAASALEIEFADGKLPVGGGDAPRNPPQSGGPQSHPKSAPKAKKAPPEQGSLF